MTQNKFKGVGVALITPFREDFSIDYTALENILETIYNSSVDYLVINGTTSEASTIELHEKKVLLSFIKKYNKKRLPIMYGIGANNTQHVLNLIEDTNFEDIDAILTVSPYYNKPSQRGIKKHYQVIADKSPVPVLLYNVPSRTGTNIDPETTLSLAHHPNIFGIKEASGDLNQCLSIIKDKPNDFMLISGDDILTVPMISIGAEGVISVLANAFPKSFSETIHLALNGKFKESTNKLTPFLALNDLLYKESNPVGIKEVMNIQGTCSTFVRLPLLSASDELKKEIKDQFKLFK